MSPRITLAEFRGEDHPPIWLSVIGWLAALALFVGWGILVAVVVPELL